jgi:thiamine pyrophosphate-dependent acetolactate synthase large subunit-like protein
VVFATSGPGMSNTTTGLLDAYCDSVPVVYISGQVTTNAIGTDAFQECDALAISRSVTRWNVQMRDPETLEATLREAFRVVAGGRPGPVLVDLPKDVQAAPVRHGCTASPSLASEATRPLPTVTLGEAAILIAAARRPVFYDANSWRSARRMHLGLLEAALLLGREGLQRRHSYGFAVAVHRHHREEAAVHMPYFLCADVLGDDLDAHLHR